MSRWWRILVVPLAVVGFDASAATWRVDRDAACPGAGTTDDPWCSLDEAFASAALEPGDTIELAESDDPYPGQDFAAAPDGTSDAPIVLQPVPGHAPIVGGELFLDGRSHWIIRGLTVDGRQAAGIGISIRSTVVGSRDIVLDGNTVLEAASRSIRVGSNDDLPAQEILIVGNHVIGGVTVGIELFETLDARVLDNDVEGVACSHGPFFQQEGITLIGNNIGAEIAGNYVHDFPECPAPAELHFVGIRSRRSSAGEIHHNLVEVDPTAGARFSGAISLHEDSFDFVVHHNVVRGISGCGLCDGADFGAAGGNTWAHNTVLDAEPAMDLSETTGVTTFGNVLRGRSVAVSASSDSIVTSAQANAYSNDDDSPNVITVAGAELDVATWQTGCACDDDLVVDPPELSDLDGLTPGAEGPLVDGAPSSEYEPDDLADIGALQAPRVGSASVSADGRTVEVEIDVVHPPLRSVAGCGGLELLVDGSPVPLDACTSSASGVAIDLVDPVWRDEEVMLVHQGVLADATAIGDRLGARVPTFSLSIDTSSLQPRPDEPPATTTTGSTGGSGDDEPTDGGEGPGSTGEAGCSCSSSPGRGQPLAWCLLLGALRRRRGKTVG